MPRTELDGSPVESRDHRGRLVATRMFECDWADRLTILNDLIAAGGEQYPYSGGSPIFCLGVKCDPFESGPIVDANGLNTYQKVKITAEYGTRESRVTQPHPDNPTQLFSESWDPSIEFLTVDYRKFKWATSYQVPVSFDPTTGDVTAWKPSFELTADQAPGFQLHGAVYTYTRHNMTTVPTELQDLEGSINQYFVRTVTFGRTLPAQSCLMLPCPIEVAWFSAPGGGWPIPRVSVSFRMHFRNIPSWNKFFRPDLYDGSDIFSGWDQLLNSDGDPVELYPVRDWSVLWA